MANPEREYAELDFTPDEFLKMTKLEQARISRLLAKRLEEMAAGDRDKRDAYLQMAKGWLALADFKEGQQ